MLVKDNPQTTMDLKRIDWGRQADMAILSEVPYRDGGNCIFFATQEAHEYFFDGAGFGEDEFAKFRKAIDDVSQHEREMLDGKYPPDLWLALTLDFMVPYMGTKFIDVKSIYVLGGADSNVAKVYPDMAGYPFKDSSTVDGFEYPFFLVCGGDGGLHTFFVKDDDDFQRKKPLNMVDTPDIVAIVTVEKAKQQ